MPGTYWSIEGYDLQHYDDYHNYRVNTVDTGGLCGIDERMQTLHVCRPTVSSVSVCLDRRGTHTCTEMPDKFER